MLDAALVDHCRGLSPISSWNRREKVRTLMRACSARSVGDERVREPALQPFAGRGGRTVRVDGQRMVDEVRSAAVTPRRDDALRGGAVRHVRSGVDRDLVHRRRGPGRARADAAIRRRGALRGASSAGCDSERRSAEPVPVVGRLLDAEDLAVTPTPAPPHCADAQRPRRARPHRTPAPMSRRPDRPADRAAATSPLSAGARHWPD